MRSSELRSFLLWCAGAQILLFGLLFILIAIGSTLGGVPAWSVDVLWWLGVLSGVIAVVWPFLRPVSGRLRLLSLIPAGLILSGWASWIYLSYTDPLGPVINIYGFVPVIGAFLMYLMAAFLPAGRA